MSALRIDLAPSLCPRPAPGLRHGLARRTIRAARAMGCDRAMRRGLELRLVDDARMRALKAEHLGVAEATDVLSFPAGPPVPGLEDEASLGELVLNVEAIARQAVQPGPRGWLEEATALVIHGLAHLLGHDHRDRRSARRMLACERRGSRAVGVPCRRPYGGGA